MLLSFLEFEPGRNPASGGLFIIIIPCTLKGKSAAIYVGLATVLAI